MRSLSVSSYFLLLFELVLFLMLWLPVPAVNIIWLFSHSFLSLLAAYWFSRQWKKLLPSANKTWLILFVFLLFLPVIGAIVFTLFNEKENTPPTIKEKEKTDEDLNEEKFVYFSTPRHNYSSHLKKARDLLSNLDDNAYLRLLIASRHLPDKEAYTLLKEALHSPYESARLMAFSLKGKIEERLQNNIQQKITLLKNTPQKNIAGLHLSISKDYIHLFDIGILFESKENLLKKAKQHCINAIQLHKKPIEPFLQLSQILKLQGEYQQADNIQAKAIAIKNNSR